nr:titin homolog [Monopterus albus]
MRMAAEVEVQTGEVGRTMAGGRLHLSPLTGSSNKNLTEIPSINQSHIINPETNKPVPAPKPRLTPKPFVVDKNPTIKPIPAPKPQTKPRPESTHLAGYKPELPSNQKPQQPVATGKPRPLSTNLNRPPPATIKTSNNLNSGQTAKPVVQPFKPAPPLDPGDPSKPTPPVPAARQKPGASSSVHSKSLKTLPAAEWSGTAEKEEEKQDQITSDKDGASITRAKSLGFLVDVEQEKEEEGEKGQPVPLRPQPRCARPRPVSAIFLDSPTKSETPVPAPRWGGGRRPLSADLTSKFESIGLSLHRKTLKANTKENTPQEEVPPQKREEEKTTPTPQSPAPDGVAKPVVSHQSNKNTEEMTVKETDENKCGTSIKSRISLLLDSSSSPVESPTSQGSDVPSPVQPTPETEPPVGVKKLIKQLIEDTISTPSPVTKPAVKVRPLPLDLTKRFSSERSPDLGSVSLSEATDRHELSKDPQRRTEESAVTPSDPRTFVDLKDFQEQLIKTSTHPGPEAGQPLGLTSKESSPGDEVQTVRASLFDNFVERHSVVMVDEAKPVNKTKDSLSSPSFKSGNSDHKGTLVTATYKEPVSPSSPLQVFHAFDTVQAVEENRAVSENVPSALWEDKAMTLRPRRSEGSGLTAEGTGSAQGEPALAVKPEQHPRYLRVRALQKWATTDLDQDSGVEKGTPKESQREVALDNDRDRQRQIEQEEVTAAPKRLKMLQAEEQPKPRATYFALTGQIQETLSPVGAEANMGDMTVLSEDISMRSALAGSQGRTFSLRRNPSLEEAFGKTSQSQDLVKELMMRRHMSHREIRSALDTQTEEMMEVEKKMELKKETEKHLGYMKELEREKQRQFELEKQAHLQFAQMKEREMQREFERQRQKAFEKEKQELEQKQLALERQNQIELEKQKLQELEREKQREMEKERRRQLEREKQQELQRLREIEREKLQEQERQRQRQREEERQRELDKERQQLEIQKEKQRMEELERIKELERQQLLELQQQKQKEKERQQVAELEKQRLREKKEREDAEKLRQMALEQEMLILRELDKERERQREMEKEHQREIEREKQRELERQRQRDLERERQRQLDAESQELENQRLRQRDLEKERQKRDEVERMKEMERRQLMEFEKQKQVERDRQRILEFEKCRLREKMERDEADKMRQVAKQQEAERQRLKEKQRKEEQERVRLESSSLRPKVVDLDSVLRNDPISKAPSQRSDHTVRWKEPSPRAEESYKPGILDIDSFTSQSQISPSKDFSFSSVQGVDSGSGARLQPTPERDIIWKVPPQTSLGFSSAVWTTSAQDPWERRPVEMLVDEPRQQVNKFSQEHLLRQEERLLAPQRHFSSMQDEHLAPSPGAKTGSLPSGASSSAPAEQIWIPREPQPQDSKRGAQSRRKSHGSQELNRMRSRSVSRRSAPSGGGVEGSLSRMRSHSAHRQQERNSWAQQKQSAQGEEERKDSQTPVHETDSQYGTWETGLRTDDSLTPASPSSESTLSPSPRKPTPPHTPGAHGSRFESESVDGPLPSSTSDIQPLAFPDAPTALLDTSALRSKAQLGKRRAPRARPSRATHHSLTQAEGEGETTEDWLYRDSTDGKVESKDDDSDSEEPNRRADSSPAVASQPQRIAMFPGMDPSALKAQLKKRGDSDCQIDGSTQLSRSPKSPFLPHAARVLPTPGGKENGVEDSPQWLKELKSKKRLSQYENEC